MQGWTHVSRTPSSLLLVVKHSGSYIGAQYTLLVIQLTRKFVLFYGTKVSFPVSCYPETDNFPYPKVLSPVHVCVSHIIFRVVPSSNPAFPKWSLLLRSFN